MNQNWVNLDLNHLTKYSYTWTNSSIPFFISLFSLSLPSLPPLFYLFFYLFIKIVYYCEKSFTFNHLYFFLNIFFRDIVYRNVDVIFLLQAGFVGVGGEWFNSTWGLHTDNHGLAQLVERELTDFLPANRYLQVKK